jgi:hypothetical protein
MAKGLPSKLYGLLRKLREEIAARQGAFPATADALRQLEAALCSEFAPRHRLRIRATRGIENSGIGRGNYTAKFKMYAQRWRRALKNLSFAKTQLAKHEQFKSIGGRVSQEWLLRVILAAPHASGRALAQSFRDIAGVDYNTVSRFSIGRIKDAWVEMYKRMKLQAVAKVVDGHIVQAKHDAAKFAALFLLHIQDEADLRLRSGEACDGPRVPRRSRASKVQQHVVSVHVGHRDWEIPTEMEALGDKSAKTLATSFESLLRQVLDGILPTMGGDSQPQSAHDPEIWVFHVLVGDGIPTNEAAAKILWSCVVERPCGQRVRYFLLLVKCATHQAALSAKHAIIGQAAACTGGELHKVIVGVSVRLYKYLINDYYEEFCFSVREWVLERLRVVTAADAGPMAQPETSVLQKVYTRHVIPDDMVALWNFDVGQLVHVATAGVDVDVERARLVGRFVKFLIENLLKVDSHPTLSRFFTFRDCIDQMLTMHLVGMPKHAFRVRSIKPREKAQKRLVNVLAFFKHPQAPQALRRASLVLQLTGGVEALTSSKVERGARPVMVKLCNGDVHDLVATRLQRLLGVMHMDTALEIGPALAGLLATTIDICLRFDVFTRYPFRICRLSKKWFPHTWLQAIYTFLHEPPERLDLGVGQQLHSLAWGQGSEAAAITWLASLSVQEVIDGICVITLLNSLDVERRHKEAKSWETSKVTHIATASRNTIAIRFAKDRMQKSRAVQHVLEKLRKCKAAHRPALAWQESKASRPRGVPFAKGQQPPAQPPVAPSRPRKPRATTAVQKRNADPSPSDVTPTKRYIVEHAHDLQTRREGLLRGLEDELHRLSSSGEVPLTRPEWAAWLDDNLEEFRAKMKTAPLARRGLNTRVRAREGLPQPAKHFQPRADRLIALKEVWSQNLARRTGWHLVKTHDDFFMIFLAYHLGSTYYVDLQQQRVGEERCYVFTTEFVVSTQLKRLSQLEAAHPDPQVEAVFECTVRGEQAADGIRIRPLQACRITAPLPRPRKQKEGENECGNEESGDSEDSMEGFAGRQSDSDVSCSAGVVDTDGDPSDDATNSMASACSDASISSSSSLRAMEVVKPEKGVPDPCAPPVDVARGGPRRHAAPLWDNKYFYIADNTGPNYVKILMHQCWTSEPPVGLGHSSMSRTLTPSHYGESRAEPSRSFILLRAWMLWRVHVDGWATAERGRHRQFQEDETLLEQDILRLHAPGGMLGNAEADKLLLSWVPALATRVRAAVAVAGRVE